MSGRSKLMLVVDGSFFVFHDRLPYGAHPDLLPSVQDWKMRAAALAHVLGFDVAQRWSLVTSVDGKPCPGPSTIWTELARRGVVHAPEAQVFATERMRDLSRTIRRAAVENGPVELVVLAPSTGLDSFRPPPGVPWTRRPCSASWLRWCVARGFVSHVRVMAPAWRRKLVDLPDLVPAEHELFIGAAQGLVVRCYDEWRGLPEPQRVSTVVLCRTGPPWSDLTFQELVESTHVADVDVVGPGSPLVPREWNATSLPEETLRRICALPRRIVHRPMPDGIVVEGLPRSHEARP
jgi:hypothetical protein